MDQAPVPQKCLGAGRTSSFYSLLFTFSGQRLEIDAAVRDASCDKDCYNPRHERSVTTTIRDVARRARVSVATVSRALAEPRLVRKETLERVLAAARTLAYRPNPAAQSLITGRTGNLGIIVPDFENPFYPSVLRGV